MPVSCVTLEIEYHDGANVYTPSYKVKNYVKVKDRLSDAFVQKCKEEGITQKVEPNPGPPKGYVEYEPPKGYDGDWKMWSNYYVNRRDNAKRLLVWSKLTSKKWPDVNQLVGDLGTLLAAAQDKASSQELHAVLERLKGGNGSNPVVNNTTLSTHLSTSKPPSDKPPMFFSLRARNGMPTPVLPARPSSAGPSLRIQRVVADARKRPQSANGELSSWEQFSRTEEVTQAPAAGLRKSRSFRRTEEELPSPVRHVQEPPDPWDDSSSGIPAPTNAWTPAPTASAQHQQQHSGMASPTKTQSPAPRVSEQQPPQQQQQHSGMASPTKAQSPASRASEQQPPQQQQQAPRAQSASSAAASPMGSTASPATQAWAGAAAATNTRSIELQAAGVAAPPGAAKAHLVAAAPVAAPSVGAAPFPPPSAHPRQAAEQELPSPRPASNSESAYYEDDDGFEDEDEFPVVAKTPAAPAPVPAPTTPTPSPPPPSGAAPWQQSPAAPASGTQDQDDPYGDEFEEDYDVRYLPEKAAPAVAPPVAATKAPSAAPKRAIETVDDDEDDIYEDEGFENTMEEDIVIRAPAQKAPELIDRIAAGGADYDYAEDNIIDECLDTGDDSNLQEYDYAEDHEDHDDYSEGSFED